MNALTPYAVFLIAVNVFEFTSGGSLQKENKCISTLEDIKKAFFGGSFFQTEGENSVFKYLDSKHRYGTGMLTGYYRLTLESQGNTTSRVDLENYKECCYPQEGTTSCLLVIAFHSSLYRVLHPLLLSLFAFPYTPMPKILADGGKHLTLNNMGKASGVVCWNLPPVCNNATSNLAHALVVFTEQFEDLARYGQLVRSSYPGEFIARFNPPEINNYCNKGLLHCDRKATIVFLPGSIAFITGFICVLFLSKHKSRIKEVTKCSASARHFLYSVMLTGVIFTVALYANLIMGLYNFTTILLSDKHFNSNFFWIDVIAGISSVSLLTGAIVIQLPFVFYYVWKHFTPKTSKPWVRAITCIGWCCVIVLLKILSFYLFHVLLMLMISPVITVIYACQELSLIITMVMAFLTVFTSCHSPYCSIPKCAKVLLAAILSLVVLIALWLIRRVNMNPMVPQPQGVNMPSIIFSFASSVILSLFVYFVKIFVQHRIRGDMKVTSDEMQPLVKYSST